MGIGEGFAALIGLRPRNVLVFLFFLLTALSLLMVFLVVVAYAGVHVGFLSGLSASWLPDGAKVLVGVLEFVLFLWFLRRSLRKATRRAAREAEDAIGV